MSTCTTVSYRFRVSSHQYAWGERAWPDDRLQIVGLNTGAYLTITTTTHIKANTIRTIKIRNTTTRKNIATTITKTYEKTTTAKTAKTNTTTKIKCVQKNRKTVFLILFTKQHQNVRF